METRSISLCFRKLTKASCTFFTWILGNICCVDYFFYPVSLFIFISISGDLGNSIYVQVIGEIGILSPRNLLLLYLDQVETLSPPEESLKMVKRSREKVIEDSALYSMIWPVSAINV